MKILGGHFSSDPGMAAQVAQHLKVVRCQDMGTVAPRQTGHTVLGLGSGVQVNHFAHARLLFHCFQLLANHHSVQAARTITGYGIKGNLRLWALIPCSPFPFRSLFPESPAWRERGQICCKMSDQPRFAVWFTRNIQARVTRNPLEFKRPRLGQRGSTTPHSSTSGVGWMERRTEGHFWPETFLGQHAENGHFCNKRTCSGPLLGQFWHILMPKPWPLKKFESFWRQTMTHKIFSLLLLIMTCIVIVH